MTITRRRLHLLAAALLIAGPASADEAQDLDPMRTLQKQAVFEGRATWGHWGVSRGRYSTWISHSNRLVPLYVYGTKLPNVKRSAYRSAAKLAALYGQVPHHTLNKRATYFDQALIHRLQKEALAAGKRHIVLIVFDGMDWDTLRAAAIYRGGGYKSGRGKELHFQAYPGVASDFGYVVTSPLMAGWPQMVDVDAQTVSKPMATLRGGYDAKLGGRTPWDRPKVPAYHLGHAYPKAWRRHAMADSAASMTTMTCGVKTYTGSVCVDARGRVLRPVAHEAQARGYAIGVVSSVPVSHATPAASYACNVSRADHQDLARDLLGLPSAAHPTHALAGVDVLIGGGWGMRLNVTRRQGTNYVPGNPYIADADIAKADVANGGRYRIVQRTSETPGGPALLEAATAAAAAGQRLFGLFGVVHEPRPGAGGHIPYSTADGGYNPTTGISGYTEDYSAADVAENPTLADMTRAALTVLSANTNGFWLMIEAGDVDWAMHDNNIDNTLGSIYGGDDAFRAVTDWCEAKSAWQDTVVIVTSDHGHYFVLENPRAFAIKKQREDR